MHTRGKRQCIELIYPDNKTGADQLCRLELQLAHRRCLRRRRRADLSGGHGAARDQLARQLADQGQTRSAQLGRQRQRTIDEMGFAWITWHDFTDEEYQAEFDAQEDAAKRTNTTAGQPQ
jgi:hypothetical protein